MKKYNFDWGESIAIRQQFVRNIANYGEYLPLMFGHDLLGLNYPTFEGDPTLIAHTREVIKRQIGNSYKHVILTNGAAGGCTIAMRAYHAQGRKYALTEKPPYFSLYPTMIKASGLEHRTEVTGIDYLNTICLVDSPSNPYGEYQHGVPFTPTIWDAVYGNRVYTKLNVPLDHDVLVGSYSKLTGLNGIRIGWIATDDDLLFERIRELVTAEYCGLSAPSVNILNAILPNYDWETFENKSHQVMDRNREEWTKLTKFFNYQKVPENGMFYYSFMDKSCQDLFNRAEVMWRPGSKMGTNDDFGRFNIGQDPDLIVESVKRVLKEDRS